MEALLEEKQEAATKEHRLSETPVALEHTLPLASTKVKKLYRFNVKRSIRKALRWFLYILPIIGCVSVTFWLATILRENTVNMAQRNMEEAANYSSSLIELHLAQIEQFLHNNAIFLAHTPLTHPRHLLEWQNVIEQQPWNKKIDTQYALELIEIFPWQTERASTRAEIENLSFISRVGNLPLLAPVQQSNYLDALQWALTQARITGNYQVTEIFTANTQPQQGAIPQQYIQFALPIPNRSLLIKNEMNKSQYLVLTLDLDSLLRLLVGPGKQKFEITLFDQTPEKVLSPIYRSPQEKKASMYAPLENLTISRPILIGQKKWVLELKNSEQTAPSNHLYPEQLALITGGALSIFLAGITLISLLNNRYARIAARQRSNDFFIGEARFQRAVNGTNDGVWDFDFHAQKTYFSPRFYELLGYSEDEIKDPMQWWLSCMPQFTCENWRNGYKKWASDPQQLEMDMKLIHKTLGQRWYRLRGVSLPDTHGGIAFISGSLTDVQTEREALAREHRLVNLIEASPDLVMVFDLEGHVFYMNHAAIDIFGTDQINGSGIANVFSQNDIDTFLNEAVPQAYVNSVWGGETDLITIDGRVIPVSQLVIGHRGEDGKVEYYSTVMHDITEIRKSQNAMREISDRFERALNSTNDGVFERRVGEDKLFMSQRMKQVLGYGKDMPESNDFILENTHPNDRGRLADLNRYLELAGGKWSIDVRVRNQYGEYRWLRSRGEVLLNDENKPELFTGIWSEVTHEKELALELEKHREHLLELVEERTAKLAMARDEAERANQAKSEFLANMSHELRTPMHAILSFAKFGVEKWDKADGSKIKHWFENIYKSGNRLLDLLNNLLDLSKFEAGKMQVDLSFQDTRDIVNELLIETEALVRNRELKVVLEIEEINGVPIDTRAAIDSMRFMQVLRNLLSNAIKFSPPHSAISIVWHSGQINLGRRATDEQIIDALVIEINDQGIGIPESELETVFDKFVQSSKTKNGAGGTGLGLSICREIIQAHRGTIKAYNNEKLGATFEVKLPRLDPRQINKEN